MAAHLGDTTNFASPSASDSAPASALASITPITSAQLIEGLEVKDYPGIAGMSKAIDDLWDMLGEYKTLNQYLVYRGVTVDERQKIEHRRSRVSCKGKRLTYCEDTETLIIRVPTREEHMVPYHFTICSMHLRFMDMGASMQELCWSGGTTFQGTSATKEADGSMMVHPSQPNGDLPTYVLETGIGSLAKLRIDARWWLCNTTGAVQIVLIMQLKRETKTILIERWEMAEIPTCMQTVTIDDNHVTGAPLVLPFHKFFLRQPKPPEQDLVLTAQDLRKSLDCIRESFLAG